MCLGPIKEIVSEGEFAGVELTFMGLNNQNLHNFLFRGFLKPWEAYTGAKINWIDLAQADYNAPPAAIHRHRNRRLSTSSKWAPRSKATPSLDAAMAWMRCRTGSKKSSTWMTTLAILKAPVGTWDGKTYRISIDGDCHTFAYRKDYFGEGSVTGRDVPKTWAGHERDLQGACGPNRSADRTGRTRLSGSA